MGNYLTDKRMWSIPRERTGPIYKQIEDLVVRHIRSGAILPGQPLPSYPWLSRTLGVADKTVRQAYASLQQAGVVIIQSGRGTFVAPHLPGDSGAGPSAQGVVGVVMPPPLEPLAETPVSWTLHGILAGAMELGLSVMVEDLRSAERLAQRPPADGLILLGRPDERVWSKLLVLPIPKVWVGAGAEGELPSIVLDYETAGRESAYRLVGVGHRRIGLLRPARFAGADSFERGVRHALGSAGLAMDPGLIQSVDLDAGETGLSAADALMDAAPTGIIVLGDLLAVALSETVWRRDRKVPDRLSVVALRSRPGPAWIGGVGLESALLDPAEAGRRAVRQLKEGDPRRAGGVEHVAPTWHAGQSLAAPDLSEPG